MALTGYPTTTWSVESLTALISSILGANDFSGATITTSTIDSSTVGATTPSTGEFTTLGATSTVTLSPASHNVVLSPSGTGIVTIHPATAGSMDNVAVGGSTPLAGAFTTVSGTAFSGTYFTATQFFDNSVATGLTAAGTTRADALALTKAVNNITTAGASTGVILPPSATAGVGAIVYVFNAGINPVQVYGAGSDTIDTVSGATGVPLTNAKRCAYIVVASNTWISAQLGVVSA